MMVFDNGQHRYPDAVFQIRDLDQERRDFQLNDLKSRVKELLKEPDNSKCSECLSRKQKPKFMCLIEAPACSTTLFKQVQGTSQVGVFCCKDCKEYLGALEPECGCIKSLKEPETWTEQDVIVLEKTGNKVVIASYLSALEGNHSEKQVGSLTSAAFVLSKYKQRLYFKEETYHKEMQLRAMTLFEKSESPMETVAPSSDDKLKRALRRQHSQSAFPSKEEQGMLLRGFGPAAPTSATATTSAASAPPHARGPQLRRSSTAGPDLAGSNNQSRSSTRCTASAPSSAARGGPKLRRNTTAGPDLSGFHNRSRSSSHRKPIRRIKSSSAQVKSSNEGKTNNNAIGSSSNHRRSRGQRVRRVTSTTTTTTDDEDLVWTRKPRSRSSSREPVAVLQRTASCTMRKRRSSFRQSPLPPTSTSSRGSRHKHSPARNATTGSRQSSPKRNDSSASPSQRMPHRRRRPSSSTSLSPNQPRSVRGGRGGKPQPKLESGLDDSDDGSNSSLSLSDIGSLCDDGSDDNNTSASSLTSHNPSSTSLNTTAEDNDSKTRESYQTRQLLADAVAFRDSKAVDIPKLLKSIPKPDHKVHRYTSETSTSSSKGRGCWQRREEAAKECKNNSKSQWDNQNADATETSDKSINSAMLNRTSPQESVHSLGAAATASSSSAGDQLLSSSSSASCELRQLAAKMMETGMALPLKVVSCDSETTKYTKVAGNDESTTSIMSMSVDGTVQVQ